MIRILCLTLALSAGACLPAFAATANETQGDLLAGQWKAGEALQQYLEAEKSEPDNVELLTKIARQYRHMASDASGNKEKRRLGVLALDYSLRAVHLAPKSANANLSVAISYGKVMPVLDKKDQVKGTWELKKYADEAMRLDPNNDVTWHVLGRWHQVLSDVSGVRRGLSSMFYGNLPECKAEDAVKCFRKAAALDGSKPRHFIELGRTYAQMGDKVQAKRYIEKGLAMPDVEKDDTEVKAKGRETLAKL